MLSRTFDVVVAGTGPAGLAIASTCSAQGLAVLCADPAHGRPWGRNFGVFCDEITSMGPAAAAQAAWARPAVWLDARRITLPHAYARIDVAELQRRQIASCERGGVRMLAARVAAVTHDPGGSTVTFDGGGACRTRVVVDATGPSSALVSRVDGRAPAFQAAYGELCVVDGHPYPPGEMAFMDLRGPHAKRPTFLYALPLGPDRIFLEETSLAARPAFDLGGLAARLAARLSRMGIRRLRVLDRERCVIPLGIAPPRRDQRIVAFGAAAGMVHPASGYQLARALASAPEVARAIAEGRTPHEAALRAYDVVWPASRLRAWDLFTFGMETLCRLDTSGTRAFFEAFFSLPPETTLRFLRAELGPASIAAAMARMLVVAGPRLRRELLRFPPSERRAMARALSLVAS